jgi:DNA-directed RNA polymerase subunit RPC12/RpoP
MIDEFLKERIDGTRVVYECSRCNKQFADERTPTQLTALQGPMQYFHRNCGTLQKVEGG